MSSNVPRVPFSSRLRDSCTDAITMAEGGYAMYSLTTKHIDTHDSTHSAGCILAAIDPGTC